MTQLEMFGLNIYVIIGGLLVLAFASVVLVGVWTALRIWIFRARQRRAWAAHRRQTRRADGKMYPPIARGVCEACGQSSTRIYYPTSGPSLCAPCYEDFWRRTECKDSPPPR